MRRSLILALILLLLVYLVGISLTGFVPIGETCCTGEDCPEENQCNYQYPKVPIQNNVNIFLEVLAIALIVLYFYLTIQKKKL
jgi:hypothetical protein